MCPAAPTSCGPAALPRLWRRGSRAAGSPLGHARDRSACCGRATSRSCLPGGWGHTRPWRPCWRSVRLCPRRLVFLVIRSIDYRFVVAMEDCPTGVLIEEVRHIIHLLFNDDPAGGAGVVLEDLLNVRHGGDDSYRSLFPFSLLCEMTRLCWQCCWYRERVARCSSKEESVGAWWLSDVGRWYAVCKLRSRR